MNYSKVILAGIKAILKASNQRIVQLDDTFGFGSPVSQNATAFLQKGAFSKYLSKSNTTGAITPTNIGRTGPADSHLKIDVAKVLKDVRNGNITETELNALLIQAGGKKIQNGEIQKVGPGIPTVSRLKREVDRDIDVKKLSTKQLIDELNTRAELAQDFQTEYELAKNEMTLAEMQKEFPFLYEKGYRRSYLDLKMQAGQIERLREQWKNNKKQTSNAGKTANDALKNA